MGILTGVETDNFLHCDRRDLRTARKQEAYGDEWRPSSSWCDDDLLLSGVVSILAQVIFACKVRLYPTP